MENNNDYIVFGSPLIGEEEINEVVDTLRSGWIGTGPKTTRFENLVKEYVGAKHAVALNSGTAGLHLSLIAFNIGPGDEVITTPLTFCATVNAIIHSGATPVLVDVELDTANIDPDKIERAITKKTKAIMPVHMAGRPCNMEKISDIAKKYNLIVIEDAAHAIGAEYQSKKIGNISDITCFSFYVTKNIITGEGGMITTNDDEIANKIKNLALHGMSKDAWKRYSDDGYKHYQVVSPGFKYNMTDMQSSLGIHQIAKIEEFGRRRNELWNLYNENFKDLPLEIPNPFEPDTKHAKHLYQILIDKERTGFGRDEFMASLHSMRIGSGVHFIPVHLHKYYRERYGYGPGDFPNAEHIGGRSLSLPFSAKLSQNEALRIINAVKKILS
jgi:dTDP-4-amino-4,6-dideoxygalactose transaminase